jgi:WD40 repeat protein
VPGITTASSASAIASQPSALLDFEGKEHDLPAPVRMAGFLGDTLVAATGDGEVGFIKADAPPRRIRVHGGAILSAAPIPGQQALLSAGDDGLLRQTGLSGEPETIATSPHWIDAVAVSPSGWIAWSSRKAVHFHKRGGADIVIETASSCQSLAFSPDGSRLAITQYGGIWLVDLERPKKRPVNLQWKGAHLKVRWSPNSRFLVSAMLENELHVWKVGSDAQGRMGSYPIRPLSFDWSADGQVLATSGADCIVFWPFAGRNGPIGNSATVSLRSVTPVCAIACHPVSKMVAAGHRDGSILFFDPVDDAAILVRKPDGSPVAAMAFSHDGLLFGYGCENGAAGLIPVADDGR